MTANAQTQWTLTEYESATTLETWRINLMSILSLEEAFKPYLRRDVIWGRKTKTNPFRGFSGADAEQQVSTLETMLGLIANYAPIVSRGTIVRNSTSLNAIWKVHLYYGINSSDDTGHPFHSETPHQSYNPPDQEYAMCKPAEESSEIAHNLPDEIHSTSTETSSTNPSAEPIIHRDHLLEQFPGDHENRVDYSLLSSSPVFSYSSKLDLYRHPVKSPQQDLFPEQDVFPEPFNRDCHSSQVPQQCISLPVPLLLSSESQIYLTDASYIERSDSATSYSDTVSDALDELPNSVDTNNHAELQHTVLTIQRNKEKQDPELTVDITGNHAAEPITDNLWRPTRTESGEPISDELLTPSKYNEQEECTPLKVLCNVDQGKINKPKSNPIYPTEVPKPSVPKLTKETEVSRLDSARESITEPITEEIHKQPDIC